MHYYTIMESPIDPLLLTSDGEHLTGLYMDVQDYLPHMKENWLCDPALFKETVSQLKAYFAKELSDFELPLKATGTAFQRKVWQSLTTIPYGETTSYKSIAEHIQIPKAVRAVGLANGKNPISIIIPCHRVIGANGKLVGYGGGLSRKQWLLAHEAKQGELLAR
ncbi:MULTISPECIES: methylated-DNA--[protein]-cysteine S-methyltransferase [Nitrosomonas]|uniref:Methylated-DNA--protein-cysteine methyltransferase n=1 Tax=Nitrosomonas communis TaxID=44574 RepID=A0A0F7KI90_9PROT|nr:MULTISPECIES: methylated-DNA--[protein]-cysteine S-methyltransferase [Nitrosomonas]AKH38574.1 cysteine methyltransferase [Nitrosomonas communis]TYP93045.1 methylated-DNA-[protein]-cysteine S-methyltransferase [Nitrosomonas communis]UVS60634.1 methylated-DNA--[protein]-cysteine S-methyltransferase [Nitrosomonas sp. PLL12]